jgi:23S rRNA pseudouridine1911/1915/1917 synthase
MNTKSGQFEKTIPAKPDQAGRAHLPPVIYEDDWLIAFDKPSGMLVAPDRWNKERGSLVDLAHRHVSPEAFNAHRIDAGTSGIVLFAKNKPALRTIARLFEGRKIGKTYLAIVNGAPPQNDMTVKTGMQQDNLRPGAMMVAAKGGMPTETRLHIAKQWRWHSLLEVSPITGKTHQIRVHLAYIGCPIVADRLYGRDNGLYLSAIKKDYRFKRNVAEKPLIGRLALHAAKISFQHPFTGQKVQIEAPSPKDFAIAIKYLDKFA